MTTDKGIFDFIVASGDHQYLVLEKGTNYVNDANIVKEKKKKRRVGQDGKGR